MHALAYVYTPFVNDDIIFIFHVNYLFKRTIMRHSSWSTAVLTLTPWIQIICLDLPTCRPLKGKAIRLHTKVGKKNRACLFAPTSTLEAIKWHHDDRPVLIMKFLYCLSSWTLSTLSKLMISVYAHANSALSLWLVTTTSHLVFLQRLASGVQWLHGHMHHSFTGLHLCFMFEMH